MTDQSPIEDNEEVEQRPPSSPTEDITGFSVKTLLLTATGLLLFGIYINILFNGENSLTVLKALEEKKENLKLEQTELKNGNQKLQKILFELKDSLK